MSVKTTKAKSAKASKPEEVTTQSSTETATTTATAAEEKKPVIKLFERIAFESLDQFEEYLTTLRNKNYNNILMTLDATIRGLNQRGALTIEEAEASSLALRNLLSAFSVQQNPADAAVEATEQTIEG